MSGEGEVLYFTTAAPAAHTGGQFVDNQGHGFPVALLDASGAPLFTAAAVEADGIANPTLGKVGTYPHLYNGATWDRQYNNSTGTLLASAARTVQTASAVQTNYNARGVLLILNVTAVSGAGSIGVIILAIDPVTGTANRQLNINGISAVTTISVALGVHYPGQSNTNAATIASSNLALPRQWQAVVAVATADSMTYSLGYSYLS